jgi:ABC-type nitrate/sulfonate/bicarbonate transport system permease component
MTKFTKPFIRPTPEGGWALTDLSVKIITIAVLLGLWELASQLGYIKIYLFSRPSKLAQTFVQLLTVGFPNGITVLVHIEATFFRILMGFALACAVGIPLGLFIGRTRWLERTVDPIVTFARSIATISLLPLAIAWFGVGELARVLLIFYGCFWIVLTNTIQGAKFVDTVLINAGRVLGARGPRLFFQVILPASLPRIFAGMKVALGMAFMVIIAVEMIGTIKGLGALIQQARTFYNTSIAIDGMIFIAIIGLLIAYSLDWLERLLLPWNVAAPDDKDG